MGEIQIIPQTGGWAGIGSAAGKGFSSGLEMLLQNKMQQIKSKSLEQEKAQRLKSLFGTLGGPIEGQQIDKTTNETGQPTHQTTDSQITDEQIREAHSIDPAFAKLLQSQKEAKAMETRHESREKTLKFKDTKDFRKDILLKQKAAQESTARLDKMQILNDRDNLINPKFAVMMEKIGLGDPAWKNADSQEFEKLSNDMFKNIKDIFGARITNIEVQSYEKTIPTLLQTKEGRSRVINNLRIMDESAEIRANAMTDIIDENNGVPPSNIDHQVTKRIQPQLNDLYKRFLEDNNEKLGKKRKKTWLPMAKEGGELLTVGVARRFLKATDDDEDEARKLAREYGYSL